MPWARDRALARIREVGVIPIIRTDAADSAQRAAEALITAGMPIVEVTMNVPDAARVVEALARRYGETVLVGTGTVLDVDTCRTATAAGAAFIVSPVVDGAVIAVAHAAGAACIPGALTPTEVLAAWRAGADLVKIFPCGPAGGARYIKALRGPFPEIPLVPTGGITLDAVPAYLAAGVAAVGIGAELLDWGAIDRGAHDDIRAKVAHVLAISAAARAARSREATGCAG